MQRPKIIRTIIVDDEPLGREAVRQLLDTIVDFQVIAESSSGHQAVEDIRTHTPDVVFLDVRMPGCDGFDVAARLPDPAPWVVFVTAHDEHALRAFDSCALDYVLKPVDPDRFQHSIARVRHQVLAGSGWPPPAQPVTTIEPASSLPERLIFRTTGRLLLLKPRELHWVEAAGNYVRLHTERQEYLVRQSMSRIADYLETGPFLRIHRSTIMNTMHLREVRSSGRDLSVMLQDGQVLPVGRAFHEIVGRLLKDQLRV